MSRLKAFDEDKVIGSVADCFWSRLRSDVCARPRGAHGYWGASTTLTATAHNEVAIKPQVRPSEIQEKIKTALHRSWYEPTDVKVSAEGGKVKLTGSVRTWYERQQAEMAAWGAPGVTQVDDSITIG
jgi:osmotically-inducible protein OsmY